MQEKSRLPSNDKMLDTDWEVELKLVVKVAKIE